MRRSCPVRSSPPPHRVDVSWSRHHSRIVLPLLWRPLPQGPSRRREAAAGDADMELSRWQTSVLIGRFITTRLTTTLPPYIQLASHTSGADQTCPAVALQRAWCFVISVSPPLRGSFRSSRTGPQLLESSPAMRSNDAYSSPGRSRAVDQNKRRR